MKRLIYLISFMICLQITEAQTVPYNMQGLYDSLQLKLEDIHNTLGTMWNGQEYCTKYSSGLLVANSNLGYELLNDPDLMYKVWLMLSALDSLQVKAVSVSLNYPLLVDGFPNKSAYLDIYKNILQIIRSEGFEVIISCQTTFIDTVFGNPQLTNDVLQFYNGLNSYRYKTEKKQMIQTVIDSLQPDYLTVEMEPKTMEANTLGLVNFSVDSVTGYVQFYLNGLNRRNVKIGAGAGSWDNLNYFQSYATQTNLDYIDIHLYPINFDFYLNRLFYIDSLADANNKKLVLGEAWLYKVGDNELDSSSIAQASQIFSRDAFSFWIPLDSLFIKTLVLASHINQIELSNPFWMRNFFGYLTYDSIQHYNASPSVIFNQLNQTAAPNIVTKTFSRTGWVYYNLIKDICSSTGIDEGRNELPGEFQLYQNYPNPFNPATIISWQSPVSSHQTLKIYDVLGNEVATLVNEFLPAGIYEAEFNASGLASGLYLYRLQTVGFVETKKMILMK